MTLIALAYFMLMAFVSSYSRQTKNNIVETEAGLVSGVTKSDGSIHTFKGILMQHSLLVR